MGGGSEEVRYPSPLLVDSLDMWSVSASLPEQVEAAMDIAAVVSQIPSDCVISNVVALGMGGSGIAGDVLAASALGRVPVPVAVVKSYDAPAFIGPDSLVFAISCSGETEETITATTEAWARGATVVVVAQGGTLSALAEEHGSPVVPVPSGIPQPRGALGALAVPPLLVLEHLGLFEGATMLVREAVDQLARRRDQLVGPSSPAAEIARRLGRTIPLIYGSSGLVGVAAQRWKTQINENAKSPAFFGVQPELSHNEVAGWGQNGDVTRQVFTLVTLRHSEERAHIAARFELMADLVQEVVADTVEVWAEGPGDLARFFDLAMLGDFVSLHVAGREGVDPGPVPVLAEIKDGLVQRR
jgi:glucose/mannose-6-phosphate isomerase